MSKTVCQQLQSKMLKFYKELIGQPVDPEDVYKQIQNIATSFISNRKGFIYDECRGENVFRWIVCGSGNEGVMGKVSLDKNAGGYLVSLFSVEVCDISRYKAIAEGVLGPRNLCNHWMWMHFLAKEFDSLLRKKKSTLKTAMETMRTENRFHMSIRNGWRHFKWEDPSRSWKDYLDKVEQIISDAIKDDGNPTIHTSLVDDSIIDVEVHPACTETPIHTKIELPCWF